MTHSNYFEIQANSYFDLGLQQGRLFRIEAHSKINGKKQHRLWEDIVEKSQEHLQLTTSAFPHLIEELRGFSSGAEVRFDDLWAAILGNEIANIDKCTTVITNGGRLIAHNEDGDAHAQDTVCVLKKTIKDITILEVFYYNTLGGNAISINSHGFVQTINSLSHRDTQVGIPRNCIARWMSETRSPETDFSSLTTLKRSSGYNHNLISKSGEIWNIESSAIQQTLIKPVTPFVHTNHYLGSLQHLENNDNASATFERYAAANLWVKKYMSVSEAQAMMSDIAAGEKMSIFNERTIARVIVNLEQLVAHIWLLRESDKGWVEYDLHKSF